MNIQLTKEETQENINKAILFSLYQLTENVRSQESCIENLTSIVKNILNREKLSENSVSILLDSLNSFKKLSSSARTREQTVRNLEERILSIEMQLKKQ